MRMFVISVFLMTCAVFGSGCSSDSDRSAPRQILSLTSFKDTDARSAAWSHSTAPDTPLNLILLSLDTTRSDRFSCYGHPGNSTPHLDRLAAEGILFENAFTPVPITLPAHTTMLTGLYPHQHGVRNNGSYVLAASQISLAELLQERGYQTGAVLGAFPVDHRFGLAQGFDFYDDNFRLSSKGREDQFTQRLATEVTTLALNWIDQQRDTPFFLWAHYFDPHAPYTAPEPFRLRFPDDPYTAEIAYMDAEIGRLIDGLAAQGLLEHTVILVAGDHGEALGEHGEQTHSVFVYDATQRIPLLMRLPQTKPFDNPAWRNQRVTGLVNLIDIFPTAWNALGLRQSALPAMPGISLLPVIRQQTPAHAGIYHETLVPAQDYGAHDFRGLQTGRWKYIRGAQPELYDWPTDPAEKNNLAAEQPGLVRTFETDLQAILREESADDQRHSMDQETIDRLRSLGYVAGGDSETLEPGKVLLPRDLVRMVDTYGRARDLAASGDYSDALALVDSLLTVHPRTRAALVLRAAFLGRLGRDDDAIQAFDRAIDDCATCPELFELRQRKAAACLAAGHLAQAEQQVQALLADQPLTHGLHHLWGDILQQQDDLEAAQQAYVTEVELFPRDPGARISAGKLLVKLERWQEADAHADTALVLAPENAEAHLLKGHILQAGNRREEAAEHFRSALAQAPHNTGVLLSLGSLYAETGSYDKARELLEQALTGGESSPELFVNLGVAYAQLGRLQDAINTWEQGLSTDPAGPFAATIRRYIQRARDQQQK